MTLGNTSTGDMNASGPSPTPAQSEADTALVRLQCVCSRLRDISENSFAAGCSVAGSAAQEDHAAIPNSSTDQSYFSKVVNAADEMDIVLREIENNIQRINDCF